MKKVLLISAIFMVSLTVRAQEKYYMDGALLPDKETCGKLPIKKEMVTKGSLPNNFSIKQYCPEVKSQSQYSTCTGWASVYAARTIAEAIRQGWTDKSVITKEAFSPLYIYAQIKEKGDDECQRGSFIHEALTLMKEKGCVKLVDFNYLCAAASDIEESLNRTAEAHKLETFSVLFNIGEKDCDKNGIKVQVVKRSLVEKNPVIIAMWVDKATFPDTKELMDLESVDNAFPTKIKSRGEAHHAMCVIGYDDSKFGGAFQIMNSWGVDWGEEGFFWVKYEDFARTVDQAFEITVKPLPYPTPKPQPKPQLPVALNDYAARIEMKWKNGDVINPMLVTSGEMCCYQLYGEVHSGDMLKMFISNEEQAYVYVFSSDMTNNVQELFPHPIVNDTIRYFNPALTYHAHCIALPDEIDLPNHYIGIDEKKGTEYWCVLYTKEALDFDFILNKVMTHKGSFYEKIRFALGDRMVPKKDIRFVMNKIEFSARSEKAVVPVIIEAVHN